MTTPRDTEAEQASRQSPAPEQSGQAPKPPREPDAVPRAGAPHASATAEAGPGWASREPVSSTPRPEVTTVLPGGSAHAASARPAPPRPVAARAEGRAPGAGARPLAGRSRRARLTLRRIDPWSVFLFSLVASVFLGIALVVAVAVMYAVLGSLGVTESLNELYAEVTGGNVATEALLTSGRIVGGAAVLAAVNVVFLTLLATLGALLYNLCASFTGGLELTFGERD
jgi:hypothetical protein